MKANRKVHLWYQKALIYKSSRSKASKAQLIELYKHPCPQKRCLFKFLCKSFQLLFNANFIDYSIIVDLLARHNCDVNQQNKEKMTAVMIAAQKGWTSVIQTLLLAGK